MPPGGLAPPNGLTRGGLPRDAARRGRRTGLIVALVALGLLLLVGTPIGVATFLLSDSGDGGKGGTGTKNPTTGTGSGGHQPTGGSTKAKYAVTVQPENLCSKIDIGPLAAAYNKETVAPVYSRNLNTYLGTATCGLSRGDGQYATLSLTILAFVYSDTTQAVNAQKQVLDSAKLNDPKVVTLTGVGEEAFATRVALPSNTPDLVAAYTVEARDGNLRWTVTGTATHGDASSWSDKQRTELTNNLATVVKNSNARLAAG
jgi:hypothetical protein